MAPAAAGLAQQQGLLQQGCSHARLESVAGPACRQQAADACFEMGRGSRCMPLQLWQAECMTVHGPAMRLLQHLTCWNITTCHPVQALPLRSLSQPPPPPPPPPHTHTHINAPSCPDGSAIVFQHFSAQLCSVFDTAAHTCCSWERSWVAAGEQGRDLAPAHRQLSARQAAFASCIALSGPDCQCLGLLGAPGQEATACRACW